MDHHVFSIMVKTTPEGSMHKEILNLPDVEASETEYYSKGSGVYTGIAGATNVFQKHSTEQLKSLKADAVIEAGYTDQAQPRNFCLKRCSIRWPQRLSIPLLRMDRTFQSQDLVWSLYLRAVCQFGPARWLMLLLSIPTYVSNFLHSFSISPFPDTL